jgi:O-antigen/teichoic acid export membrane protein
MAYYRAGHKGSTVTIAAVAAAASLLASTLFFVRVLRWGIVGALLAQTLIYGLLAAFLLVYIAANVKLGVSLRLTWRLARFGLPLILVMSGGLITQTSALYFLSHYKGLEEVGIYSLGLKLAGIVEMVLILPFEMAYEPFVYGQIGHPDLWNAISRLLTYLMVAFTFFASGVVFIARDLLPLIAPPAFSPAYLITFLVLPALAFRGVYYVGESLLFLEQRTDIAGTVVTCFSLLSVLLNYLLISQWGMYGASLVFIFTTVGAGATVMRIGLRMAPVRIEWDRLCAAALLLFGFLGAVYSLRGESALVYYSAAPALMCLGALALFATGFIREDERRAMRHVVGAVYDRAYFANSEKNVRS